MDVDRVKKFAKDAGILTEEPQDLWNGERQHEEEREEKLLEELLLRYESAICTAKELESKEIVPRKPMMGKWMR